MIVRETIEEDLPQIRAILEKEILEGVAHFGEQPPTLDEVANELSAARGLYSWFSAIDENGGCLGFARAGRWKPREGYDLTCEIGVYVRPEAQGKGVGATLYRELIASCWDRGYRVIVGGIRLPNEPSVRLHEGFGFQKVAHFPAIGFKSGVWHDVGYWVLHHPEVLESQFPTSPTK